MSPTYLSSLAALLTELIDLAQFDAIDDHDIVELGKRRGLVIRYNDRAMLINQVTLALNTTA